MSSAETITEAPVQPIVLLVDKADPAPEADGIRAAAIASVMAYASDLEAGDESAWERWLSGRFTKSVRRADAKTFPKVVSAVEGAETVVGKARALALRPAPYSEYPKAVSRLQVGGTSLPRVGPTGGPVEAPLIVLNQDLGMSTGKAAAQAAHALFAWFLALDSHDRREWSSDPRVLVAFNDGDMFNRAKQFAAPGSLIVDAGLTEIAPQTTTAFVLN